MVRKKIISISRILVAVFLLLETVFPIFNIRSHETNAACAGLCLFLGIENNEIQQGNKTIRLDNGIFVIDDSPEPISATLTVRSGMYDSPKIYIFGATEQIELIPTTEEIQIPVTIIPELKNGHYSAIISVGADGEYEEGAYFYFISQQIADGLDLTSDGFKLSVGPNAILNNETHAVRKYDHANDIYYYEVESFADLYATYVGLYLCDQDNQCSNEDDGYTYTLNTNGYSSEFSNLDGYRSDTTIQLSPTLDNDFLSNLGYYSVSFSVLRDGNVDIPFWALNRISTLNHQLTKQSQLAFKLKDSIEPNYVDKNTVNLNSVQLLRNDEEIAGENGIYFLNDLQDYNSFTVRFNYDCGEENLYCDGIGSYIVVESEDRNEDVYYGNNDGDWLGFNPDEMTLNFETGFADYTYTTNLKYKTFEYNSETNQWDIPVSSEILATRTITIRTTIEALLNAGLLREQFNIVSVSQGGEVLERKYDETNDLYYYETPKSGAIVQVEVGVNFLKGGHIYTIDSDETKQQFTSEDNGKSKIVEMSPYFSSGDQYSDLGYQRMYLSFYRDNYEEWFGINLDKQVFLKPISVASDKIEIISISQNGEELEYSNGKYKTPIYSEQILITYKLTGLEIGKKYESHAFVDSYNGPTDSFTADATEKTLTKQITLNNIKKQNNISITASEVDDYGEGNYYQWLTIPTEIIDPNFIELGTIIIDSVRQNGTEIIPTLTGEYDWEKGYSFELNDVEDYEISFHTDQAMDDLEYQIGFTLDFNNKKITASGSELKSGITFSNEPIYNDSESRRLYIGAYYEVNNMNTINLEYEYNDVDTVYFNFIEDETLPRFNINLKYFNQSSLEAWKISPKYHNENNPLILNISGAHYNDNENYNVSIKIHKAGQEIYSKDVSISGRDLNNGKDITLENFVMQLPMLDEILGYENGDSRIGYYFDVEIDGNTHSIEGMAGYDGWIKTATIHENGEFNAIGFGGGAGGPNMQFQGMSLSETAFNNKSITMYYVTEDYDDQKTYGYELYYGQGETSVLETSAMIQNGEKIAEGTMTGEELNNGVLKFNVKNTRSYDTPMYVLVLKENDKIANIVATTYTLWDGAGVYSVLPKGTKDLYLGQIESWYISPKENDIDIKLTGVNFEDDKQYIIEAAINGSKDGSSWPRCFDEDIIKTKQIKGSELNSGIDAIEIKYNEVKTCDDVYINIRVTDSDQNRYQGTYVDISFQDINDYFETENGIVINNGRSRIKSIVTSVKNLIQKNKIINDGLLKVFKDGEEFTGNVGTGMVARILDKFGRAIVDMDMVVQGDANGDGIMGIIDYIKIKKDIMDTEKFTDGSVFFEAADMNENNKIDILDYIKIRKAIMEEE